jgi:hypothetical protein
VAVLLRLLTLTLAQALDLATFWVMVRWHGLHAEANPLVADLFETLGLPGVVLAKIALIVLVGALVFAAAVQLRTRTWAMVGGLPVALGIAVGLIGGITNAATLLR